MNKRRLLTLKVVGIVLALLVILISVWFLNRKSAMGPSSNDLALSPGHNDSITNYLLKSNLANANFGGKVFISYEELSSKKAVANQTHYIWALIQEYYKEGGLIKEGTGTSLPLVIHLEKIGEQFKVLGHEIPRDGSRYHADIKRLFPVEVQHKIVTTTDEHNQRIEKLRDRNLVAARLFFK